MSKPLTPQLSGEAEAEAELVLEVVTPSIVLVNDVADELFRSEELLVSCELDTPVVSMLE